MVTRVTLKTEPSYNIRQYVYVDVPLDSVGQYFNEIVRAWPGLGIQCESSIFTDWQTTFENLLKSDIVDQGAGISIMQVI